MVVDYLYRFNLRVKPKNIELAKSLSSSKYAGLAKWYGGIWILKDGTVDISQRTDVTNDVDELLLALADMKAYGDILIRNDGLERFHIYQDGTFSRDGFKYIPFACEEEKG